MKSIVFFAFFNEIIEETDYQLKKIFEGDYSSVGRFSPLAERFLGNDDVLFNVILPEFNELIKDDSFINEVISFERDRIKKSIAVLENELSKNPCDTISLFKLEKDENSLKQLSINSMRIESDNIYHEVICGVLLNDKLHERQTVENYFYVYLLKIMFDRYSNEISLKSKYSSVDYKLNNIYQYYKELDFDLYKEDKQFRKYNLFSLNESCEVFVGLPSRVYDKVNNLQFVVNLPEHIIRLFEDLRSNGMIRDLAFNVQSNPIIESERRIFILLGNVSPVLPIKLKGLERKQSYGVSCDVVKFPGEQLKTRLPSPAIYRYYSDSSQDSIWVFVKENSIVFEEILQNQEVLEDCVVTQLIHLEYYCENNDFFISHIDHEYVFYTYDEFDARELNSDQKGSARKRIKTFKIDGSKVPFLLSDDVFFLITILDAFLINTDLLIDFLVAVVEKSVD